MRGVNFFGHAWLAAGRNANPRFVLGAMLPDLAPMAGLRLRGANDAALSAGIAHHLAVDAAFHALPVFQRLTADAARALRRAGLRRGPARGAAHIGLELLLDGWLAQRCGVPDAYRTALAQAPQLGALLRFAPGRRAPATLRAQITTRAAVHRGTPGAAGAAGGITWTFPELCRKLAASPLPEAYAEPSFTAARVAAALARRPRLALTPAERNACAAWLRPAARTLAASAESLLDAVISPDWNSAH